MSRFECLTPRLPVSDLPRAIAFYRDRLGFRPTVLWPEEDPTFAILERDAAAVAFFAAAERGARVGDAELYFRVEDVAGLHARLENVVAVEWGPEVYSYGRREFAIRDPDGYLVIFTEPTEDPPTTAEPG